MAESSDPLFECASALKSHEVSHSQRGARATHLSCQAWYDEDDSYSSQHAARTHKLKALSATVGVARQ